MPSTNTSTAPPDTPTTGTTPGAAPPITRFVAQVCYGLFLVGPLFPPLLAIALLLNLLRRGRARGTWLSSHFSRQTKDLAISAGAIFIAVLPFALGGSYLLGSMIGAGQISSDSSESLLALPLVVYFLVTAIFMGRMIRGWQVLHQGAGV